MAVEEVGFEIIKTNDVYEIRKYSDRLVIETATSNQGMLDFPRKNQGRTKEQKQKHVHEIQRCPTPKHCFS